MYVSESSLATSYMLHTLIFKNIKTPIKNNIKALKTEVVTKVNTTGKTSPNI